MSEKMSNFLLIKTQSNIRYRDKMKIFFELKKLSNSKSFSKKT